MFLFIRHFLKTAKNVNRLLPFDLWLFILVLPYQVLIDHFFLALPFFLALALASALIYGKKFLLCHFFWTDFQSK